MHLFNTTVGNMHLFNMTDYITDFRVQHCKLESRQIESLDYNLFLYMTLYCWFDFLLSLNKNAIQYSV